MFDGSQHVRGGKHATSLAALGGYTSAVTDEDATHFVDVVPASYVDYALTLEAERMRNLMFRKAVIDGDRDGVKDEIARAEASPVTRGFLRFLTAAFTKHPYAWTAGGNAAELDKVTSQQIEKFYETYYQPNNAMIVLVGRITAAESEGERRRRSAGSRSPRPSRRARRRDAGAIEPPQTAAKKETVDSGQLGLVIEGFHNPDAKDNDIYAIQLATQLLGSSEKKEEKPSAPEAAFEHEDPKGDQGAALRSRSAWRRSCARIPGSSSCSACSATPRIWTRCRRRSPTRSANSRSAASRQRHDLRRAKATVQTQFVFAIENVNGLAEAIGRSWILTGDPQMVRGDLDEIEKVTRPHYPARVQDVLRTREGDDPRRAGEAI